VTTAYGFRVIGGVWDPRRPVDWRAAFDAYCACDDRAQIDRQAYLSHFWFGPDFDEYLARTGSEKRFTGPCCCDWLHWDIDRGDDLQGALNDARRLVASVLDRYQHLDDDALLIFLSGRKGFHIGVPASLWGPTPSLRFN
jgi:hypothetical protein